MISVKFCSMVFSTRKTVVTFGTGTSFTVKDNMTQKLLPPAPRMAQKRSSPIAFRSKTLPLTLTILASIT
ncbi:hypothetical protein HanRHA438_Chr08g0334421 [Helianthus annuus]|nr:hypothetical protein HanIR_Chr08g0349041 [Helianthus annuus]KAJ0896413.1 hypothetical protein HanRHA438_Chr08g0334421 [Helianthus annuus]